MDLEKIKYKIEDRMLIGSIYDNVMKNTKYRDEKLSFLYNVMVAQKHRMLYYKKLKKKYYKCCTKDRPWEALEKKNNANTIWVCWLQGIEEAPLLVKRCVESLKLQMPEKKLVVLDKNNYSQFVTMPDFILKKWEDGIIGNAHFTDMLRLELLTQYGGYWIDATVLCTDSKMISLIDKEPLFMFSFYYFGFNPEIMELNNWFIKSETNNNMLCLLKKFLYSYWKDMNRAVDYFTTHLFLTMATEYYKKDYEKMPIVSQVDSHVLATYIYDDFDESKYEIVKQTTGFHKLSTRFEAEKLERENCFYDVIIKQGKS